MFDSNTWNHLTVLKNEHMFVLKCYQKCVYKQDLSLYNLEWFICHKTQPNYIYLIYNNNE